MTVRDQSPPLPHNTNALRQQLVLSALWIIFLLNSLFRDVHEFLRPGILEQVMTGSLDGVQLTDQMLLASGMFLQVPIVMVVGSLLLTGRLRFFATLAAAVLTMVLTAFLGASDPDDWLFLAAKIASLCCIVVLAWTWRGSENRTTNA